MTAGFLFKRLVYLVLTAFIVTLIIFGVTQILPANAAIMILGEHATEEALAAVNARLGLDQPLWCNTGRG